MKKKISVGTARIFLCDETADCSRMLHSPKDILCEPTLTGLAMADGAEMTPKDSDYDMFAACYPYMLSSPLHTYRFAAKLKRIGMDGFGTNAKNMWEQISAQLRRHPITHGQYCFGGGGFGVPYRPASVWESEYMQSDARLVRIALPETSFFSLPDRPDQPDALHRAYKAGKQLTAHEEAVLITDNLVQLCRTAFADGKIVWLVSGDRAVVSTLNLHTRCRFAPGLSLNVSNYADIAQLLDCLELRAPRGKLLLEARNAADVQNACTLASAFPGITVGVGAGIRTSVLPPLPPHRTVFLQDPECPAAFPAAPTRRLEKMSACNLLALLTQ